MLRRLRHGCAAPSGRDKTAGARSRKVEGTLERRGFCFGVLALLASAGRGIAQGQQPAVDVRKDALCGCCSKWVDHLRSHGFVVRATDMEVDKLNELKATRGIPRQARSCHTALVGGYVVEGHVPADDVKRLLKERPAIVGIAVPGMPAGSPGMEVPGGIVQPYDVLAFAKDGSTRVFASHGR
jgi:hypothetical protein